MSNISFFWKLFLAILLGIFISSMTLIFAFRLSFPLAFSHHMSDMSTMMKNFTNMPMGMHMMNAELFDIFNRTSNEALWIALPIVLLIALFVSWGISRLISAPLKRMFFAAQEIASGNYHQRIPLSSELKEENMDPLQQLASGFNQMAASLEATENMRQQLIGDISHELRTPLTTIKGSMEGLIDGVVPGNEQTYHQIYQEADRLQRLVEDLQELSRIEGSAYQLEKQLFSITDLIESIENKYANHFHEKKIQFIHRSGQEPVMVFADRDRLEQVLVNLLINALQFTQSGDSISISAVQRSTEVQIQIQDSGVGIAAEHLPHIFTRFYRADKSRSRPNGGSGIGLTISKHLIEAHGGTISVESQGIGSGSTFIIKIPLEIKKGKEYGASL